MITSVKTQTLLWSFVCMGVDLLCGMLFTNSGGRLFSRGLYLYINRVKKYFSNEFCMPSVICLQSSYSHQVHLLPHIVLCCYFLTTLILSFSGVTPRRISTGPKTPIMVNGSLASVKSKELRMGPLLIRTIPWKRKTSLHLLVEVSWELANLQGYGGATGGFHYGQVKQSQCFTAEQVLIHLPQAGAPILSWHLLQI